MVRVADLTVRWGSLALRARLFDYRWAAGVYLRAARLHRLILVTFAAILQLIQVAVQGAS